MTALVPAQAPIAPDAALFFDVDGCLNHEALYAANRARGPVPPGADWLDPACVARLDALARRTGAVLVGISAWPLYLADAGGVLAALAALVRTGLTAPVVDWRPTRCPREVAPPDFLERWCAVRGWLAMHPGVARWAIVDDQPWGGFPADRFVRTDIAVGLTDEDCERAAGILARNDEREYGTSGPQ